MASTALSAKEPELSFRFQHYLIKHNSVNGPVNEQTVQDLYDMLLENSRKYLDVQPSTPAASSAQTKGRENFSSQRQATGKNSTENACFFCGSEDHWMKDCPHRSTQSASSTGQSSSSGAKTQPVKYQPKPTTGQKGKSKGKGKGKGDPKKKPGTSSSGGKTDPQLARLKVKRKKFPSMRQRIKRMKKKLRNSPSILLRLKKKSRSIKKNNLSRLNR